jgi:PPP family 3-phenylpropionic acid transporter
MLEVGMIIALAAGPVILLVGLDRLWILYTFLMFIALFFAIRLPSRNLTTATAVFSRSGYGEIFKNRIFLMFVLLGVLISVPNAVNLTFISLYIRDLGGSSVSIGWAAFLSAFFEVPVFLLLDRYIRRETRFMIACLIGVSLLFAIRWGLMAIASEPYHILAIQVLHCVTFGAYYYLGTTLTDQLIPKQYRASGQAAFALTWGGVSGIIAGYTGGWLYQTLGAVAMYQTNAVIALFGTAGFIALLKFVENQQELEG